MIGALGNSRISYKSFYFMAASAAAIAIALHSPGQVSMDTSLELYEAHIGRTISNQPPFMSALMRLLGGGGVATALLVLINSVVTYWSFVALIEASSSARCKTGFDTIPKWRLALCALIILNPIVFLYVGIIWKDVLFGSAMLNGVALSILASSTKSKKSWLYAIGASIVFALVVRIRQQGVFMAPILMLLPLVAVTVDRNLQRIHRYTAGVSIIGAFLLAWLLSGLWMSKVITQSGNLSFSRPFTSIEIFDIAGIIAKTKGSASTLPVMITPEQQAAVEASYSSERVDYLVQNSVVVDWFNHMSSEDKYRNWLRLIMARPEAYLEHRFSAYLDILNIKDFRGALPIHVGVEGNSKYLHAVDMPEQRNDRALLLYRIAADCFPFPFYRHWFYFLSLVIGVGFLFRQRMSVRFKSSALIIALAAVAFYLSYLPTGLASDFRYLYGNILLVSAFWLLLLCGSSREVIPR